MARFSLSVVDAAVERCQGCCELCGGEMGDERGVDWSAHHRIPRGMGGSQRPELSAVANILIVCGSGTSGCHGAIEAHRAAAHAAGWLLYRTQDPLLAPVLLVVGGERRRVLLSAAGGYVLAEVA